MSAWNLPEVFVFDERAIRYGIWGDGPPLVAVHGTPWSSYNLRHLIEALAADFRVYAYDLLGYGQSDKAPGDVSLGIQNRVLDRLLDHWQLEEPAVMGHDFGGTTVLRTHLINARRFSRMILVDPVALSPWGSPFFEHVRQYEEAFAGVPAYIHEAIVRAYVQTAAFTPMDAETLKATVAPWQGRQNQPAFYRQIAQADAVYTDEIEPLLAQIKIPVLILWGQEDTWIPPASGRALHTKMPNALFHVIPDAGHLVIEEKPDQLVEMIRSFFQDGLASKFNHIGQPHD